jgi:hypothetical protein
VINSHGGSCQDGQADKTAEEKKRTIGQNGFHIFSRAKRKPGNLGRQPGKMNQIMDADRRS